MDDFFEGVVAVPQYDEFVLGRPVSCNVMSSEEYAFERLENRHDWNARDLRVLLAGNLTL